VSDVRRTGRGFAIGMMLALQLVPRMSAAVDLVDVFALAKSNDPIFQSARYALEAAKQKRPEAFSALLPALGATGSADRTLGKTRYSDTPEISRGFNGDQWALQLTQPLFRIDSVLVYDEARADVEQAIAQFAAAGQDLILRFARAYFDEIIAERHVVAARAQVEALDEQLLAARRSFEAGVASVSDVDDTQSRAALAVAQQVGAMNDREAARAALEAILGTAPPRLDALRVDANLPSPSPADLGTWAQRASEDHPNVKAAQAALKAAGFELARTRAQRLPSVNLVASYGRDYSGGNITEPDNFETLVRDKEVSVQFSLPLVDGGGMHAQALEALARRTKAQMDLLGAQRQASLDARQSYGAVFSGISQVQALEAAVAAGKSAVKGNRIGYGLGIRINSDVLNAEQQLYSTMQDLAKARYDTLFAGLKLKAAAGELSEDDLGRINTLLEPASRSDSVGGNASFDPVKSAP
jgi:outer membrane protein